MIDELGVRLGLSLAFFFFCCGSCWLSVLFAALVVAVEEEAMAMVAVGAAASSPASVVVNPMLTFCLVVVDVLVEIVSVSKPARVEVVVGVVVVEAVVVVVVVPAVSPVEASPVLVSAVCLAAAVVCSSSFWSGLASGGSLPSSMPSWPLPSMSISPVSFLLSLS